ncbi:MAG: LamG domain-containing protein [Flavisolibacter sp.]|nr:LamG domain-containing protein [Flavisolibacter sp.]
MKKSNMWFCATSLLAFSLALFSCQKLDRPKLGEIVKDPDPPTYNPLKFLFAFDNNVTDAGESKVNATTKNVTYVAGVNGQAAKIGTDGYILVKATGDTTKYPNGFAGLPADTLANLGSFTLAFWMNGAGPVIGGAQGIFSISNKSEFWGNLEIFLENYESATDPNAAWLKIHLLNAGVASGNGEEWVADDNVKLGNVLNRWTHIAVTYDASTSKITVYKDGASANNRVLRSGNYGKIKFNNFNGMVLGSFAFQTTPSLTNHGPEGWAKSFNGALDQFRIYNRALTDAEVTQLFTSKQ